jgi:hypothetical protein
VCYNKKVNNLFRKNMGVIVNKEDDKNDELTRRINADLRTKMYGSSDDDGDDEDDGSGLAGRHDPDYVADSEYMKDLKTTGRFGWVWIVLIILAIASIISIILI